MRRFGGETQGRPGGAAKECKVKDEPAVPYAEQVREALQVNGPMTRAAIRRSLPKVRAEAVDDAIDGMAKKRKLARKNEPVRFPDGSTRMCTVYSLKQGGR